MTFLEQLKNNNFTLDCTIERLKKLFDDSKTVFKQNSYGGLTFQDTIEVDTLYESENVTVTRGIWHKKGQTYPNHKHSDSIEYLICTQGKFIVNFAYGMRIIGKGECMSIPIETIHSCTPLEDESKMLGICIPPEQAYLMPLKNTVNHG